MRQPERYMWNRNETAAGIKGILENRLGCIFYNMRKTFTNDNEKREMSCILIARFPFKDDKKLGLFIIFIQCLKNLMR